MNDKDEETDKAAKKRGQKLKRKTEKRTSFDGRKVVFVTEFTQTDWEWKDKAEKTGKGAVAATSADVTSPDVKPADPTPAGAISADTTSRTSSRNAAQKTALEKSDSLLSFNQTQNETEVRQPTKTVTDLNPLFFFPDDEFGIPMAEISSDSDSSEEGQYHEPKHHRRHIPSHGPPQILRYIRESDIEPKKSLDREISILEASAFNLQAIPADLFSGVCEFCGSDVKPFPTLDQQLSQPPESLYCCQEYQDFVEFALNSAARLEEEALKATQQISVKVHAHHGSTQERQLAKEKAMQRMRERAEQRREQEANQALAAIVQSGTVAIGTANASTTASVNTTSGGPGEHLAEDTAQYKDVVARQMKTINYQLSSQRCLEEGWTLRAPSPLETDDLEIFIPEPLPPVITATGKLEDRPPIEKFYPDGSKFLTIFSDGTGNVFYPSGRLSILISSVILGQNTYIVQDDSDQPVVLAVFESNGSGSCSFSSGKVRLTFDQINGLELDHDGGRRKAWNWKDQEVHVHVPPFQPIVFGLNSYLGMRFMAQDNIVLTMTARQRSCRFNVGSRLKPVTPDSITSKAVEDHQLVIREHRVKVETILNKITNFLKFPKSPKVDHILPPLSVLSQQQKLDKMKLASTTTSTGRKQHQVKQIKLPPLDSSVVSVS